MNWTKLSKIAFLGTDRAGLKELNDEEWASLKLPKEGEPAELLLKAATLSYIRHRAGKQTRSLTLSKPLQKKAPESSISSKAALFLEHLLEKEYSNALPEFFSLCDYSKQTIPTYLAVDLMEFVEQGTVSWEQLKKVLADNALSLLEQHPQWKKWTSAPFPDDWESGKLEKRTVYLQWLREIHPAEAVERLKESWPSETTQSKASFLEVLNTGLSDADEGFLEACLEEDAFIIRERAAHLLLRLPDSALSISLYNFVFQFVEEREEGYLMAHSPEEADPYWEQLGLQKKQRPSSLDKEPASLLEQLIERLHPSYWNAFLNLPPNGCLSVMEKSHGAEVLIKGVIAACLWHEEQDWIDAMAERLFVEKTAFGTYYVEVLERVSAPVFNRLLTRRLKNQSFLMEENSLGFSMLQLCDHPWSDELALAVLLPFQQWLAGARSAQWQTWHYKKVLKLAAYRVNPNLAARLASGWQFQSYLGFQWQEDIDKFNKTLNFRKGMRKAILENSKKESA